MPSEANPGHAARVWSLLERRERRIALILIPTFVVSALLQAAGVASVLPFLSLVSDPSHIQQNHILARAYDLVGANSPHAFLILVGVASLIVLIGTNAVAAATDWIVFRFSWRLNHLLSEQMLERYLARPFAFFLDHNSSQLLNSVLYEVTQAVNGVVLPTLQLMVRGVVVVFILALLVAANPLLAAGSVALIGGAYAIIFAFIRERLRRGGQLRQQASEDRYKAAIEALAGAQEIKLLAREPLFVTRFRSGARRFARQQANLQVMSQLPRYALETVAYGGMLFIVVFQLFRGADVGGLLPILGLYALGTYRLLPATQVVFNSATSIRYSMPALDVLYKNLKELPEVQRTPVRDAKPLPFDREVVAEGVDYSYPGTRTLVLRDIHVAIPANARVGLVGATGSGKTTAAAALMGLLQPVRGRVRVDDVELNERLAPRWHRRLGYVPQHIFLTDDSIKHNIAFGVPDGEIDTGAVERAAVLAHIHDFILEQLPSGYETAVGERGVRLSGGQRQRLGIARAMYNDPDVLILDEATSALDNVTEELVIKAIEEIGRSKTIVQIAHRLSTVRNADLIYLFDKGRVIASGTYDELMAKSDEFRSLALQR